MAKKIMKNTFRELIRYQNQNSVNKQGLYQEKKLYIY